MKRMLTIIALLTVTLACRAQHNDIVREDTLSEVTVISRTARNRVEEVQIGVEKVDIATLSKVPALFGEKDIIKSLQLLPGVKSENEA